MNDTSELDALRRAHPTARRWLALPTDRTAHEARVADGALFEARLASRRFYQPQSGVGRVPGPEVDLLLSREPITASVRDPDFLAVLERASSQRTGLVVVAPSLSEEVVATLAVNNERKTVIAIALLADVAVVDALAQTFQTPTAGPGGLHANRVYVDEVVATARATAFLARGGAPIGLLSVGGASADAMWSAWRAQSAG